MQVKIRDAVHQSSLSIYVIFDFFSFGVLARELQRETITRSGTITQMAKIKIKHSKI